MIKRKNIKTRGKIKFSEYFQEFNDGDRVTVKREHSLQPKFPKTIQGRSGVVSGKRGESYIVKIVDLLPEDASDINKIFSDISLNEDEVNKILGIVKNSK